MRIVSISMHKGGSGKSTTTVNLAAALAEKGKSVLVVDLDSQRNSTMWLYGMDEEKGVFEVFEGNSDIRGIVRNTDIVGIDIVPASKHLMNVERVTAGEISPQTMLRDAMKNLEGYDFVLIDCPPNLGILTINSLVAADEVLMPVVTHVMALDGLVQLQELIEIVKEKLNSKLEILGILPCRLDGRTRHSKEIVSLLKERYDGIVCNTSIRENVRLAEAYSFQMPIIHFSDSSSGAEDYRALAKEVIVKEVSRV